MRKYLWHVTLNTGHGRKSPRDEVAQQALDAVALELSRALTGKETDLRIGPGTEKSYRLKATVVGAVLLCTVLTGAGAPLVTFGVAPRSRDADKLWSLLHQGAHDLATKANDVPEPPWCAVRIEMQSIANDPGSLEWLPDFERLLAWVWIEKLHRDVSAA